jgi:outer membrane protein OmpA-like peptidoglycan-associated protein
MARLYNDLCIFNESRAMFFKGNKGQPGSLARRVLRLLALAAGLFALVIGIGVYQDFLGSEPKFSQPEADPSGATHGTAEKLVSDPNKSLAASDAASVKVEQGTVMFYFASGKAELAPGAGQALAEMVKGAQAGRKLVISGFHDPVGDPVRNAALAQRRALAVQEVLTALGVAKPQIEIRKPELTTGGGSNADARRVEISLQ